MDITGVVKGAEDLCTKADFHTYLTSLGFKDVDRIVAKYGLEKVQRAIEYTCSRPPGEVQNLGAYIRKVLRDTRPLAERRKDPDYYTRGRYGHLVNR